MLVQSKGNRLSFRALFPGLDDDDRAHEFQLERNLQEGGPGDGGRQPDLGADDHAGIQGESRARSAQGENFSLFFEFLAPGVSPLNDRG